MIFIFILNKINKFIKLPVPSIEPARNVRILCQSKSAKKSVTEISRRLPVHEKIK